MKLVRSSKMKVISYVSQGNSFPIIVEDKGSTFFVKLQAGMSGKYALVNEWLGNSIGKQLNINTQKPYWIEIDDHIILDDIYIEVRDLVHKSKGVNIGFEYIKETHSINLQDLSILSQFHLQEIFLFDIIMINIDRTSTNINLMQVGEDIVSLDYESSLLVQECIERKDFLANAQILYCLRNNPLYDDSITDEAIDSFLMKIGKVSFQDILVDVPNNLLDIKERQLIMQSIMQKTAKSWNLKSTLMKLKDIKLETKNQYKKRVNKNQEAFRKRMREKVSSIDQGDSML